MEFDCEKVMTPFTKDKERWLGWKGYFSDFFIQIKEMVEANASLGELTHISVPNFPYEKNNTNHYMYFYPVEEPEPKKETTWRPYKSLTEMAIDINGYQDDGEELSEYALVRSLVGKTLKSDDDLVFVIFAIDFNDSTILLNDIWYDMERLFREEWEWFDASAERSKLCGIEE